MVSFERSRIPKYSSKNCTNEVMTDRPSTSIGVQADQGFYIDHEVLDSYLSMKMSESLADLKDMFVSMEKDLEQVLQEKKLLEKKLEEKMKFIKDLTSGTSASTRGKEINTDTSRSGVLRNETHPQPKKKAKKRKSKTVCTQTDDMYKALASEETPIITDPNDQEELPFRSTSSNEKIVGSSVSDSVDSLDAANSKIKWMFDLEISCARCKSLLPHIRLLRCLKQNMTEVGFLKFGEHSVVSKSGVVASDVIWNALGPVIRKVLVELWKLCQVLENLPLNVFLKQISSSLLESLKHLLMQIPFPPKILNTLPKLDSFLSPAFSVHIFGLKIKVVIKLLRFLHSNKNTCYIPRFFRTEVAEVERKAYRLLFHVAQSFRNKSNGSSRNFLSQNQVKRSDSSKFSNDSCLNNSSDNSIRPSHSASFSTKNVSHDMTKEVQDLSDAEKIKNSVTTVCPRKSENFVRKGGQRLIESSKSFQADMTVSPSCTLLEHSASHSIHMPKATEISGATDHCSTSQSCVGKAEDLSMESANTSPIRLMSNLKYSQLKNPIILHPPQMSKPTGNTGSLICSMNSKDSVVSCREQALEANRSYPTNLTASSNCTHVKSLATSCEAQKLNTTENAVPLICSSAATSCQAKQLNSTDNATYCQGQELNSTENAKSAICSSTTTCQGQDLIPNGNARSAICSSTTISCQVKVLNSTENARYAISSSTATYCQTQELSSIESARSAICSNTATSCFTQDLNSAENTRSTICLNTATFCQAQELNSTENTKSAICSRAATSCQVQDFNSAENTGSATSCQAQDFNAENNGSSICSSTATSCQAQEINSSENARSAICSNTATCQAQDFNSAENTRSATSCQAQEINSTENARSAICSSTAASCQAHKLNATEISSYTSCSSITTFWQAQELNFTENYKSTVCSSTATSCQAHDISCTENAGSAPCSSNSNYSLKRARQNSVETMTSPANLTASSSCSQFTSLKPMAYRIRSGNVLVHPLPSFSTSLQSPLLLATPLPSLPLQHQSPNLTLLNQLPIPPLHNILPAVPSPNPVPTLPRSLPAFPLSGPLAVLPLPTMCASPQVRQACSSNTTELCMSTTNYSQPCHSHLSSIRTTATSLLPSLDRLAVPPADFHPSLDNIAQNQSNVIHDILPCPVHGRVFEQHSVSCFQSPQQVEPVIPLSSSTRQHNVLLAFYRSLWSNINRALLLNLTSCIENRSSTQRQLLGHTPMLLPKEQDTAFSGNVSTAASCKPVFFASEAKSNSCFSTNTSTSLNPQTNQEELHCSGLPPWPVSLPETFSSQNLDTLAVSLASPSQLQCVKIDDSCCASNDLVPSGTSYELSSASNITSVACTATGALVHKSGCTIITSANSGASICQSSSMDCVLSISKNCQKNNASMECDFPISESVLSARSHSEAEECTFHDQLSCSSGFFPSNSCYDSVTGSNKHLIFSSPHGPSGMSDGNSIDAKNRINAQPTILKAIKTRDNITIRWLFPVEFHALVQQYLVHIMNVVNGDRVSWTKAECVKPSSLPMTFTLARVAHVDNFQVSVKALYIDGECSRHSVISI